MLIPICRLFFFKTFFQILANFPFLERFVTSQALKTNAAKNAMYIEEKAKELIRNRLDKGQVHDNVSKYNKELLFLIIILLLCMFNLICCLFCCIIISIRTCCSC